jgi:hypothetical protein
LKNVGDNNAAVELLVDAGNDLLVIEIEPTTDIPDAVRRAIAGCAVVISRFGVDQTAVSAAVVLPRLPNERVEYYRVVRDVYERLGIVVHGIPVALLLLSIRTVGGDLDRKLKQFGDTHGPVQPALIAEAFGYTGGKASVGLEPAK